MAEPAVSSPDPSTADPSAVPPAVPSAPIPAAPVAPTTPAAPDTPEFTVAIDSSASGTHQIFVPGTAELIGGVFYLGLDSLVTTRTVTVTNTSGIVQPGPLQFRVQSTSSLSMITDVIASGVGPAVTIVDASDPRNVLISSASGLGVDESLTFSVEVTQRGLTQPGCTGLDYYDDQQPFSLALLDSVGAVRASDAVVATGACRS